jgi:hypothetical protein
MEVFNFVDSTVGYVVTVFNLLCITNLLAKTLYSSSVTFVGFNGTFLKKNNFSEGM